MEQVPDDVTVDRILIVRAEELRLPKHAPDGELMSYVCSGGPGLVLLGPVGLVRRRCRAGVCSCGR